MELKVNIESKEQAQEIIKQLQEFINKKDILSPDIEEGDDYWFINCDGNIYTASVKDIGTEVLANIYKTKEIAERALEFKKSRKVWNFIENWAMHNSDFVPDWSNIWQYKYQVYYSEGKWNKSVNTINNYGLIYFSEEEAEKLVEILNSSDEYKL